ncbi:PREDICTED: uncharacterized protein LOC108764926 [Trachymyrmex cornetzi]|uniref:uncharacterized protein LOC108764926 n=1 Tax=Trachymyrmex cornetzi TaxID=471704 RepID=UPI00084F572F|nr:PREDICTED: uncharacterized protein LOC108764926 [Trachymyrmex cornetzi]
MSRGTTLQQLKESELWWSGPPWMRGKAASIKDNEDCEQIEEITKEVEKEAQASKMACNLVSRKNSVLQELINKFSSITKMERVLAHCIRFTRNLRKFTGERKTLSLSASEVNEAHLLLIRHVQASELANEIANLRKNHELNASSKILQLQPFLDKQGILRVGGRLHHTPWEFERKHPIILPDRNRFSRLLFVREHQRLLHAGQQLLLASIREKYWPLRGRDLARRTCRECVRCFRAQPPAMHQIMGSLPRDRVNPDRAFAIVGIDFAGPIATLISKGRGRRTHKSYIALFICLSTRAIHLEAASELSTAAFIATLKRFVGRRGRPLKIYSDNAKNFVGANKELQELRKFVNNQVQGGFGNELANEGIEWSFIPPHSPHMGGIWEAGVKSCKHHLKRVMGNSHFTFEEFTTVLIQIEACVNSRPLCPLSADPSDLQPLTPAHFIAGGPLTSLLEANMIETKLNRLNRWQLVQRTVQHF